jgi:hypothetical protein
LQPAPSPCRAGATGRPSGLMVAVTLLWSIAGVVTRQLEHAQLRGDVLAQLLHRAVAAGDPAPVAGAARVRAHALATRGVLAVRPVLGVMFTAFMVALTMTTWPMCWSPWRWGRLLTALLARVVTGHRLPARTWVAIMLGRRRHGLDVWPARWARPPAPAPGWARWSHWACRRRRRSTGRWCSAARRHGESIDLVPAVLLGAVISSAVTLPLAWPL